MGSPDTLCFHFKVLLKDVEAGGEVKISQKTVGKSKSGRKKI